MESLASSTHTIRSLQEVGTNILFTVYLHCTAGISVLMYFRIYNYIIYIDNLKGQCDKCTSQCVCFSFYQVISQFLV